MATDGALAEENELFSGGFFFSYADETCGGTQTEVPGSAD